MSEYQYYEFQTLDRPLTGPEQAEINRLSSRVQLTATRAIFVYNYSDFRSNPRQVLTQYFDAMLYLTNWGTRQVMFRFPKNSIPAEVMSAYQYDSGLEWSMADDYIVLNIELNNEGGDGEWLEGEGTLSGLVQVRDDILQGDYRALYLAWLMATEYALEDLEDEQEDEDDLTEPPVPPNLKTLSPPLRNFIDFFGIDPDLVTAAAQTSPSAEKSDPKLSKNIDLLTEAEKRDFLQRLLDGEPRLNIALINRLRALSGADAPGLPAGGRRTLTQLATLADEITQQQIAAEKQKSEKARLQKLVSLAPQEAGLWAKIPGLIAEKRANTYEEAVNILKDLRDLLTHHGRATEFQTKLAAIRAQYPTLTSFHRRLKENNLA